MLKFLFGEASPATIELALAFVRIGIGILTIGHGIPKMGGMQVWHELGTTFMNPLGIYFWPTFWGFLGGCTEFFGGIAYVLGFGTRIASIALIFMMTIATVWHLQRGDSYMVYSFPLSLIIVFIGFLIIGSGIYSVDYYLANR